MMHHFRIAGTWLVITSATILNILAWLEGAIPGAITSFVIGCVLLTIAQLNEDLND